MGVVYKLKQDVIDFIVNEKKENTALSCRKLVDIIYKRFQIKLSKSSINTIIKSAQLSSPVGRHGSDSVKRAPRTIKEKPPVVAQKKEVSVSPSVPPAEIKRDILYDGMGCIFLKAAQWELANVSVLGKLLRQHIKGGEPSDIDATAETLLFMDAFGIKTKDELAGYTQQGLWALNGIKEKIDTDVLFENVSNIATFKELCLDFSIEVPLIFTELHYIKLILEDGTAIWLDAQLKSVWPQNSDGQSLKPPAAPMNKVMTTIARHLFTNASPSIFFSTAPQILSLTSQPAQQALTEGKDNSLNTENTEEGVHFSREFCEMAVAFGNVAGKRIIKIAACDTQRQEMACFDEIPAKKRIFIAGIWPWQKEFQCFQGNEADTVCVETPDRLYVTPAQSKDPDLISQRVLLVRESADKPPFMALITNASLEEMSNEKIVISYVERWPRLSPVKEYSDKTENIDASEYEEDNGDIYPTCLFTESYDIFSLIRTFFLMIRHFCEKRFFCVPQELAKNDISLIISSIYGISGSLNTNENSVHVNLVPDNNYPHRDVLEFAVMCLNETDIYDQNGRKLTVGIN